jgi:hypothetical protein
MPALTTPMQTALAQPVLIPFVAVRLTLPTVTLALLTESAVLTFAGSTFVGEDPTYGTLINVEDFDDGGEDEAPSIRISLSPKDLSALTALAAASNQGSRVEVWEGLVDKDLGTAVVDPVFVFDGYYDQPEWLPMSLELRIECGSIFDLFMDNEEGARLTDSFHQSICPGEKGFQYVFETEDRELPWGSADKPRPVAKPLTVPRSRYFNARYI